MSVEAFADSVPVALIAEIPSTAPLDQYDQKDINFSPALLPKNEVRTKTEFVFLA